MTHDGAGFRVMQRNSSLPVPSKLTKSTHTTSPRQVIMTVKNEASDFEIDSSPKKKAKTTTTTPPIKWTEEEIQLLCDLRSNHMDWAYENTLLPLESRLMCRDIGDRFPGRTIMSVKSCYNRKGKEMTEVFDPKIVCPFCRSVD